MVFKRKLQSEEQQMRIRPGILIAIMAILAVLIGGRLAGWYGRKPAEPTESGDAALAVSETPPVATIPPKPIPARPLPVATQPPPTVAVPQAPTPAAPIADWEEKIDGVLTAQEDDGQKAKRLLAMFPNLPEDGQVEAAQHISNLLPDEQFASLAQNLTNAAMPEAVLDVLMTDVLNRPNQLKLDALVDVARIPNHPKAEEALDVLKVFLDGNDGDDDLDWDAIIASGNWQPVVDRKNKWLKENPEE